MSRTRPQRRVNVKSWRLASAGIEYARRRIVMFGLWVAEQLNNE